MTSPAIEFIAVDKSFPKKDNGRQSVLDGVSFSIPRGKTTVIAGGSGQGKSVTLKLILGFMRADAGKILVDGEDVTTVSGKALSRLRTRFGVLFQGVALFDSFTVFDNVALPLRERTSMTESEIAQTVTKTLDQLGLAGHEEKFPAQLSGGMCKRVGLARALQLDPQILLCDEPTTGLDPVMTNDIYELFVRTQAQFGYTSVIVSHDIPRVFSLADQIIILHQGEVDVFDNTEQLYRSQKPYIEGFVRTARGALSHRCLVEK